MTSACEAPRAALEAVLGRIPLEERGVTAKRAAAAIEEALGTVESNLTLLDWEAARVTKHVEARRVRAEQARNEAQARAARIAKVEQGKKKR